MSTKHDVLTETDMASFRISTVFLNHIKMFCARTHMKSSDIRILDWGCGRGRLVAALIAEGFDVYGVDIDPEVVDNAKYLFSERGHDSSQRLRLLSKQGRSDFPAGSFHIVFSAQVMEHVSNLDQMTAEMARIMNVNGFGLHIYPGHRTLIEPHLFMPLVHWLPKNSTRHNWIRLMVALGIEPRWPRLMDCSISQKALEYYRYSVDKTYYRSPSTIRRILSRHGFSTNFWSAKKPSRRLPVPVSTSEFVDGLWNWTFSRFFPVWMLNEYSSNYIEQESPEAKN